MAVLDADGYLTIRAFQTLSDAAHIYGQQFLHIFRSGSTGTMADLLEDGDMLVDFAGQLQILVLYIFSKSQQNSGAELVIQETALDVAGLGDAGYGDPCRRRNHFRSQVLLRPLWKIPFHPAGLPRNQKYARTSGNRR